MMCLGPIRIKGGSVMSSKECSKCRAVKPMDAFYRGKDTVAGFRSQCKECSIKQRLDWARRNREKNNSYNKAYLNTRAGKMNRAKALKKWTERNREKIRAHYTFNNALRYGKVTRQLCVICGSKAHAHHPDYSLPFHVVWLCPAHHKQTHRTSNT